MMCWKNGVELICSLGSSVRDDFGATTVAVDPLYQNVIKPWKLPRWLVQCLELNFLNIFRWNMLEWWWIFDIEKTQHIILLMDEIPNNHLGCIRPWKWWDKLFVNWCRISSINSMYENMTFATTADYIINLYSSSFVSAFQRWFMTHRIHGTGIFTCIWLEFCHVNVPM